MTLPTHLRLNAFSGPEGVAPAKATMQHTIAEKSRVLRWALGQPLAVEPELRPPQPADPTQWQDPRVGYGVILPEPDGLTSEQLKTGSDAPEPIFELIRKRPGTAVLRYRRSFDPGQRSLFLRNWAAGTDISLDRPPVGLEKPGEPPRGALPSYLLIAAPPGDGEGQIPWDFQYVLNTFRWAGRLDLDEDGLSNYISHLLNGWSTASSQVKRSVIWPVDHGGGDITTLMRKTLARKIAKQLEEDDDLRPGLREFDGSAEILDGGSLIAALRDHQPALILTTSHGRTGPTDDLERMAAQLGLPVDGEFRTLDLDALVDQWQPQGAIWWCHACCSAGADSQSIYSDLFPHDSEIATMLRAVAALGARTAPLPRRLLGASAPLRAFVGQVEPTFDWTLRSPLSRAHLTEPLRQALYERLYQPQPIGLSLNPWYEGIGALYALWEAAMRDFDEGVENADQLLYLRLAARDLQSTVLLGDPTAIFPALP